MSDSVPPSDPPRPRGPARRRLALRVASVGLGVGLLALVGWVGLMERNWVRAPYSGFGNALAWTVGLEERAYNFGVVEPGHIYRSGRPDLRFLSYLRQHYGLVRILSLNGPNDFHERARERGFRVTVFDWSSNRVPPRAELDAVLALMDEPEPLLVHCSAGSDRSGYAIAEYRIRREGWTLDRAFAEMEQYWHKPYRKPWFQAAMREQFASAAASR